MPAASIVFSSIAELFGLFAIGWFIRWRGYAAKEDLDRWGRIAAELFYPMLIFHSILQGFDATRVRELWVMPVLALGLMAAGALAGLLLRGALRDHTPAHRRTFVHTCAVNNFIYLPVFIIQNSLPATALADFFVFNLGSTVGFWTIGVMTLGGHENWRVTLRRLCSPALLSMFVAVGLAWSGWGAALPAALTAVFRSAGSVTVPLMLIIIGASFQGLFRRDQARDLALLTTVRLVLLPLVYIGIIKGLPLPPDLELLAIIVALMPASAVSAVMARLYGGSPSFASAATLATHLGSLITVPLAFWWLSRA